VSSAARAFEAAAHSHEQLGRLLRDARLVHKVELREVARQLHIRVRYLEAIEEGALDELPGNAYVKGYLRRYALYLGLPPDEVVAACERLGALPGQRFFYIPERIRREPHPGRRLIMSTLFASLFVFLLWGATEPRPLLKPAVRLQPPPVAVSLQSETLAPACFEIPARHWPACYSRNPALFTGIFSQKPVKTVMQLKPQPRTGR
jgi:transcriptional regulator with XRE-family HTH domain